MLGLVVILATMETLISPPHQYSIRIACDGLSALSKSLLTDQEYFNSTHKDFDIISRIIHIKTQLKAAILPIHVRGHQDSKGKPLTRAELLNVRMDALAKGINQLSHNKDLPIPDALPLSQIGLTQVDYKMDPIVSNLRDTLVEKISGDRLKQYWKNEVASKHHLHLIGSTGKL